MSYVLCFHAGKVAIRNRRATIVRLIVAPFLFIFLVFVIEKAITSNDAQFAQFKSTRDPQPVAVTPIPACETDSYNKRPCYDFIYTPNDDGVINVSVDHNFIRSFMRHTSLFCST